MRLSHSLSASVSVSLFSPHFPVLSFGFSKMARASSSIPLKHKVDVVVDPKENTQKSRCFHVDRI